MIDLEVVHIEETDSTNRWMKENGKQNDMVVVAEYQTAGRGCGTNSWESERGKNLLCSVFIHPKDFQAKSQFIITQLVSVALCKAIEKFANKPVEIKWPNDIYVGDKKICGVLIENRLQGRMVKDTIIGIGLNVNQTEFKSDAPNPVSIKQLTGKDTDRDEVLKAFIDEMNECCRTRTCIADYKARLYRREGKHKFMTQNTVFEASIVDVKDDGRLMLEDEMGIAHLYRFKEVTFVIKH
jgi:BirA family biotin operon repressor/biotin-[acetyl-CoA-carboxylase] ligase